MSSAEKNSRMSREKGVLQREINNSLRENVSQCIKGFPPQSSNGPPLNKNFFQAVSKEREAHIQRGKNAASCPFL